MRKKKYDPYGGFLPDLFPEEFIAHASQDLFGQEMICEKMSHESVRNAVVEHALHHSPILYPKPTKNMKHYTLNIHNGDTYNIGTVGTLNVGTKENKSKTDDGCFTDYEEMKDDVEQTEIPAELATPLAMKMWEKLRAAGFVDADNQPLNCTKKEMMYIADIMSDKLQLRYKWSVFEKYWHTKRLSQEKSDMISTGILPERHKEIEMALQL